MSKPVINNLRFNQDHGCFSCALDTGLRLFNIEPLTEKLNVGKENIGSISHAEMLFRTNLIGIVGGGSSPKFADNTVLIRDESQKSEKFALEYIFSQPVMNIRMKRNKLFCILRNEIHVFSFPNNSTHLYSFRTRDNFKGLCEISTLRDVVVFPGHKCGSVEVVDLEKVVPGQSVCPVMISAHQNELASLALNQSGSTLATASRKGTLIRVFNVYNKQLLVELRRGSDTATLYCISFSHDSAFLCASSDKGTVHIFAIEDTTLNKRSTFKKMGFLGHYGESQWGLANFTVPAECACICAFGSGNSVVAVCVDGTFHKYSFTTSGSCNREAYNIFLDIGEDMY
ncbi:WD repeat domain phosphoinositide-interacting protein 4-like, partial [Argonauta hians]